MSRRGNIEELRQRYPYIDVYKSCQKMAFGKAVAGMGGAFVAVYAIQDRLWHILPYKKEKFLLAPIFAGVIVSYCISAYETMRCKERWDELEAMGKTPNRGVSDFNTGTIENETWS